MGFDTIGMSQLSLQYVGVPVKATLLTGTSYDPTGLPVAMAFMPQATQVPQDTDWQAATWATVPGNLLYPYAAYCLVGPGGTVTLGIGTYVMYLKVTGVPEIPVVIAGQLQVS